MGAAGDGAQAFWAVINGEHRGHDSEQDLGGADVAGGFFPADVLLACLQRETIGGAAVGVMGHADQATGQAALEGVLHRHESRVRSTKAERNAEALAVADADVRAEFAWGLQQGEGKEVGGDDEQSSGLMGLVGDGGEVGDGAEGVRVGRDDGGGVGWDFFGEILNDHLDA